MDYTLLIVLSGTTLLGFVSGTLGSFAVLRRQSLLGDAISHAALPGIAIAFLLSYSKHPLILLSGAFMAGWIGTLLMMVIITYTDLKKDAALGIVLSVFFGIGLVFLTLIQRLPTASKTGLNTFLFGNASTLLVKDVLTMAILGCAAVLLCALLWKEFKLITFDLEFAASLGFPSQKLEIALTTLTVIAIVIGLQSVGVVLMSSMIIAPAAAARQWTDKLHTMVALSSGFGILSCGTGVFISSSYAKMPTGPAIVLVISAFVIVSLLFAPNRGLLWSYVRHYRNRQNLRAETLLQNLYLLSLSHTNPLHAHDIAVLHAVGGDGLSNTMESLYKKGLVHSPEKNFWGLTQKGHAIARKQSQGSHE